MLYELPARRPLLVQNDDIKMRSKSHLAEITGKTGHADTCTQIHLSNKPPVLHLQSCPMNEFRRELHHLLLVALPWTDPVRGKQLPELLGKTESCCLAGTRSRGLALTLASVKYA